MRGEPGGKRELNNMKFEGRHPWAKPVGLEYIPAAFAEIMKKGKQTPFRELITRGWRQQSSEWIGYFQTSVWTNYDPFYW